MTAAFYGSSRWRAVTEERKGRREGARFGDGAGPYDPREPEGPPAPVRRYFWAVLGDGQPPVPAIRAEPTGTFNGGAAAERWKPFRSGQRAVTRRPGFVRDAAEGARAPLLQPRRRAGIISVDVPPTNCLRFPRGERR